MDIRPLYLCCKYLPTVSRSSPFIKHCTLLDVLWLCNIQSGTDNKLFIDQERRVHGGKCFFFIIGDLFFRNDD